MTPAYSICMCNYNMEDTLNTSLVTILDQIDDDFEVVVVDDGSTDNSVSIIRNIQRNYPNLRLVELKRDRKRRLGATRNISVECARGDFVFLNIDCDDIYQPYIRDFALVFHKIEACLEREVFLKGRNINIGRREFLLKYGPYRNTFAEDRDMWHRLAADGAYIYLDHIAFMKRLQIKRVATIKKALRIKTWEHLIYEFRRGRRLSNVLFSALRNIVQRGASGKSPRTNLVRLFFAAPAYVVGRFESPLPMPETMPRHEDFKAYRERTRGTFKQIMERNGCDGDLSFLRSEARYYFEHENVIKKG